MSNINLQSAIQQAASTEPETAYKFFAYDSKEQYPAPDGQRLVTCLYRAKDKTTPADNPNEGMFIPDWITEQVVVNNIGSIAEYVVSFLQHQEDERIKDAHKNKSIGFGDTYFQLQHILTWLADKGAGARLNADNVKQWFVESGLAVALHQLYLEKTADADKAAHIVEYLQGKLCSLASPKTIWSDEEQEKIIPLLESVKDTSTGAKLLNRISKMTVKDQDMLDAL